MKAWFTNLEPRERLILLGGRRSRSVASRLVRGDGLHTQTEVLREAVASKQRMLGELARVGSGPAAPAPGAQAGRARPSSS